MSVLMAEAMLRGISRHLTEAGCPAPDRALATKKLIRPVRGPAHMLNGAMQWVALDVEEPEPVVIQDPATMTRYERAAQVERLRYLGYKIDEPDPEDPKAQVIDALDDPPRFDPSAHSVVEVNAYLRELGDTDPVERSRVLFAELNGRARNGILRRHKEAS